MREKILYCWMYGKRASGLAGICRARCIWEKESSNGILRAKCQTAGRKLFCIAEEASGRRWLRTTCKRWAIPTWNRWMADGRAGWKQEIRRKRDRGHRVIDSGQ